MKPRRHTILKVIALLLAWGAAGAAVNVAVAWGCAMSPWNAPTRRLTAFRPFADGIDNKGWQVNLFDRTGHIRVIAFPKMASYEFPIDAALPAIYPSWSGWPKGMDDVRARELPGPLMVDAAGWPASAFICSWRFIAPWEPTANHGWTDAVGLSPQVMTLPSGGTVTHERALPLLPLWPGFAVNTLFYAGVLWLLFCGPFALRRMIRRRRGQCPHCAYPIGQNERCTECGAELESHRIVRHG